MIGWVTFKWRSRVVKYPGMIWVALIVIGAAFVFVAVLAWLTRPRHRSSEAAEPAPVPGAIQSGPNDRYAALLAMVLGDRDMAERLIAHEATKMRPRLIELAIERLRGNLEG